jgi:hypothetical protein
MQLNPVETYSTEYVFIFRQHDRVQNYGIKISNTFLKIVANLKYLGTTIANQNCINYEINGEYLHFLTSMGQDLPLAVDTYSDVQLRGFWEKRHTSKIKLFLGNQKETFPACEPVNIS